MVLRSSSSPWPGERNDGHGMCENSSVAPLCSATSLACRIRSVWAHGMQATAGTASHYSGVNYLTAQSICHFLVVTSSNTIIWLPSESSLVPTCLMCVYPSDVILKVSLPVFLNESGKCDLGMRLEFVL